MIIKDLLALGQALRLPQDDHALACVLKSPLVPKPLSEDELFQLAYNRQSKTLWQRLSEEVSQSTNAEYLAQLREDAATLGPFEFFSRAIQSSSRAIQQRLGSEAEDAVAEFLNLAIEHETSEDVSITSFLDRLARSETVIKREMEQATGEVRIMTVHGAKGLEAPVVILADATYLPVEKTEGGIVPLPESVGELKGFPVYVPNTIVKPPIIDEWKEARRAKALAERYRLLYVAMTRARDELYVFGSYGLRGDREKNWYVTISKAFEQLDEKCEVRQVPFGEGNILRHGAEPKWIEGEASVLPQSFTLPAWATTLVSKNRPAKSNRLAARDSQTLDTQAATRGVAIHRILEMIDDVTEADRAALAIKQAKKLGLEDADIKGVLAFLVSEDATMFFAPSSSAEVELRGTLPNGEKLNSRADRLADDNGTIWLLDYKTGPRQVLDQNHAFVRQMARYDWLLRQAKPGTEVKAALLWTQTGALEWLKPELLSRSFDQMMQAAS